MKTERKRERIKTHDPIVRVAQSYKNTEYVRVVVGSLLLVPRKTNRLNLSGRTDSKTTSPSSQKFFDHLVPFLLYKVVQTLRQEHKHHERSL